MRAARSITAAALVAGLAVLLLGGCGGGGDSSDQPTVAAEVVDSEALKGRVEATESPIYWAGEQEGTQIELSVPEEGRTYVRYLTEGAEAGDPRPNFLTVGTYAFAQPIPALEKLARKPGGVTRSAPGGGVVYFEKGASNAYLAYPEQEFEIEVFDPEPGRAKELATSGAIVPIE
jgi:hypothetical protein